MIIVEEEKKAKLIQEETALRQEHREKIVESLHKNKSADNVSLLSRKYPDMHSKDGMQIFLDEGVAIGVL